LSLATALSLQVNHSPHRQGCEYFKKEEMQLMLPLRLPRFST
jgi:hypothetical protein